MKDVRENTENDPKCSYQQYQELGGIINEKDYQSALSRARSVSTLNNRSLIEQAKLIAKISGIALRDSNGVLDQRTILYGILRTDANPEKKYHHSQMSDQQLFAEALRMLEDTDSLQKLIRAHPNIFPTT